MASMLEPVAPGDADQWTAAVAAERHLTRRYGSGDATAQRAAELVLARGEPFVLLPLEIAGEKPDGTSRATARRARRRGTRRARAGC
jgi:hypothetical protein